MAPRSRRPCTWTKALIAEAGRVRRHPAATTRRSTLTIPVLSSSDVLGREVSVNTPFGQRKYDLVVRNRVTGAVTGVEVKSSQKAFERFDEPARQQFAADRWLNREGGLEAVGKNKGMFIDNSIKSLWEIK